MVNVEIDQARFGTKDQCARDGLIVWMPLHVGETACSRNSAEHGDVGARGALHELHERDGRADHDAAQQAGAEHSEKSGHRHDEIGPARNTRGASAP